MQNHSFSRSSYSISARLFSQINALQEVTSHDPGFLLQRYGGFDFPGDRLCFGFPEEMEETFDEIQAGRYSVEERSVLQLICDEKHLQDSPYALNEIAILKRDSSSMISIRTAINGAYLNTYQADGLVIATPTGSTAYSLSVGGPIMVPHSNTVAITPVAPHSLNVRPIVIRDDWEITLDVESRSHNFLVAIDGRSETCKETTQLTIRRADYSVKVVKRFNHIFFDTLRSKMMWGADGRR